MEDTRPVKITHLDDGAIVMLSLARPKGNVLDAEMVSGLRQAVAAEASHREVRAVILAGEGPNFSYGASVAEHLPDQVADMLAGFHGLFRDLIKARRPVLSAVQGMCLGGGLELAAFAQRVFATPGASLGQPEVALGVFAPVGSIVLPKRVGQAWADDLLLSGRQVDGEVAHRIGLVDELAEDPVEAALEYARANLVQKSAASLAMAVAAARAGFEAEFLLRLERLEAFYLEDLMSLKDPVEGLQSFLDKRRPVWTHS